MAFLTGVFDRRCARCGGLLECAIGSDGKAFYYCASEGTRAEATLPLTLRQRLLG